MKSYFFKLLLLFLLFSSELTAKTFFWEVNGTQGGKVYILGSLNIGKQDLYPLDKEINEAFDNSSYLLLEQLKSVENSVYINQTLFKDNRYDANDSISSHLSKKSQRSLQFWLKSLKLPENAMDSYAPWIAAEILSSLDVALRGDEERLSLENYFYKKAQRANKRIYGLERVADRFMRLQDPEDAFQESLFRSYLAVRSFTPQTTQERFEKYKEANASYFVEKMIEPIALYPVIQERVLWASNIVYFNKVLKYRANKRGRNYFLIIGLEHVLGEMGILAFLEEAGIDVKSY